MEENNEEMVKNLLSNIELFEGYTIDVLFKEIFDRSTEDRQKALEMFDVISSQVGDKEDTFMIGDKANPYLDIAQKATDNLTKMLTTAQKFIESARMGQTVGATDASQLLALLDEVDAMPDELKNRVLDVSDDDDDEEDLLKFSDIDVGNAIDSMTDEIEKKKEKSVADTRFTLTPPEKK